jgi:hypothetical protein
VVDWLIWYANQRDLMASRPSIGLSGTPIRGSVGLPRGALAHPVRQSGGSDSLPMVDWPTW